MASVDHSTPDTGDTSEAGEVDGVADLYPDLARSTLAFIGAISEVLLVDLA